MGPKAGIKKGLRGAGLPIVGIGASAGGMNAFKAFLSAVPADFRFALIFIQHLSAKQKSLLPGLLAKRRPDLPFVEIQDGMRVEPGMIFICPPGKEVRIRSGFFHAAPGPKGHTHYAIDEFFESLAEAAQERSVAVVLSGAGTDGARGIHAVSTAGGCVFVQDPDTAEHQGMPRAAIDTGEVDGVFPPEVIAAEVLKLVKADDASSGRDVLMDPEDYDTFYRLIQEKTGQRFVHYKKSVVSRRIKRRMYLSGITSVKDYLALVANRDSEASALAYDLMIGVTSFFRDRVAWKALKLDVVRKLVAEDTTLPLRVWAPACATGEEAYTVAMTLLHELALHNRKREVVVFATDVNDDALERAREGKYPASISADLPPEFLHKYFRTTEDGQSVMVVKAVRERVVFARQDLLTDPPFSRLDLVICRNLLIYLEPDAQDKCISLFHYALKPDGYLFLGNAESTGRNLELFKPTGHKKCRIYQKADTKPSGRLQVSVPFAAERASIVIAKNSLTVERHLRLIGHVQEALIDEYAPAAVAIDRGFDIVYHNGPTNRYLRQPRGAPTQNLLELLPDSLANRIRSALYRAGIETRPVSIRASLTCDDSKKRQVTLRITRLQDDLFLIVFREKASAHAPVETILLEGTGAVGESAVRQLETELATTRAYLRTNIEQLKSLNEELQSSNEELQAANEELETSREELQSLNEELITVNSQLQEKIEEQEVTNSDLNNFFTSTNIPTLFMDHQFRVRLYTPAMSRLVKLIPSDVGRPITDISRENLGPGLIADAQTVLERLTPVKTEIRNGDTHYVRATLPYRTSDNRIEGVVVTYSDITDLKRAEARTRHLASFPELNPNPVIEVDASGKVTFANPGTLRILDDLGFDKEGVHVFLPHDLNSILSYLARKEEATFYREIRVRDLVFATTLHLVPRFDVVRIYARDITERKRAEEALRESEANYRSLFESSTDGIFILDLDGNFIDANRTAYERLGYTREEFLSMHISELDHPRFAVQVPDRFRQIHEHGVAVFESGHLRKDGSMMPVEVNARLYEYRGKQVFFSVIRDITERRHTEEALQASLERWRSYIEVTGQLGWTTNANGEVVEDLPSWRAYTGQTYEAIRGWGWVEALHPDDVRKTEEAWRKAVAAKYTYEVEYRICRHDGVYRHFMARGIPVFKEDGSIREWVGTCIDITERKRAEEEVIRAKEEWERTFDSVPDMIAIIDNDHTIVRVNKAMAEGLGCRLEECVGMKCYEAVHGTTAPPDFCPHILTMRDGSEHTQEVHEEYLGVDLLVTTTPLLDKQGKMVGSVHVAHDITERKHAEEALRKLNVDLEKKVAERTRFYSVLAKTSEAIVRIRDRQLLFEEVCRICVEEGFFRLAWVGLLDPESREVRQVASYGERGYLEGIRIIAADVPEGKGPTGRAVYEGHYVINTDFEEDPRLLQWRDKARAHGLRSSSSFPLHAKGEVIGALTIYSDKPSFFTQGEISPLLSLCEDISFALDSMETEKQRSEAEDDLRRLNEELEERVRLRTNELEDANKDLESFIYSVSHDLRAPLRSMSGFVKFLSEDWGEQMDDKGRDYLACIRKGTAKMNQLIDDLLNLSGLTRREIEKSAVDMSVLASSIISGLRESEPGRDVSVSLQQGLTAPAEPRLMEIALSNIFSNAWKFTAKEENPRIEFGAVEKDGKTVYYVRDNGAGFDPDYIEKMFLPFQRLHPVEEFEGTGIGLAIVERIVHRHGGRIWAVGEKGKGATVFFTVD